MFSSKEVKPESEEGEICLPIKPEPEEGEICLPVNDHHVHSSYSDSYSNLGGAQASIEPKLVTDYVKTECGLSPERLPDQTPHLRKTEKGDHPAFTLSQQNLNEANESNIIDFKTELKNDPAEQFDDFLAEFMKEKTNEEAVNLNQTEDHVLRLSEHEVNGSLVCHALKYKRIMISSGAPNCPKDVNGTFSKPSAIRGKNERQSCADSDSGEAIMDKKVEGKQKYFCHLCGRGYVHSCHLGAHMKTHTGERKHRCPECGSAFYHNYTLIKHMAVHSGTRPFECDKCDKSYRRLGDLRWHERLHTESHHCTQCWKTFAEVSGLKKHQVTHTGEQQSPFNCTECDKGFRRAWDLKQHQMSHTGEKPYTCTECGHGFVRSTTLKKHMRIHTRERPYLCSECGKTFPYAFSYSTHMNKIHNIVIKKR